MNQEYEVVIVDGEIVTYSITDMVIGEQSSLICCLVEIDTDGDMSIVNPYTSKRLWIGSALDQPSSVYDAIARAIETAKELEFLGDPNAN
jgi:hypothetical protein